MTSYACQVDALAGNVKGVDSILHMSTCMKLSSITVIAIIFNLNCIASQLSDEIVFECYSFPLPNRVHLEPEE